MQVVKITPNMTFGQVAVMPEFAGFGEYLMICRPTTWERMWNLPLVSGPNAAPDSYASQRIVRGVQRIVDLADSGKRIAYDIWDEKSCCRDPTRRTTKLFFFPGEPRKPFVLVIAGGGYQSVCNAMEGFPSAVELNEAGYNAFVLSYRVRIKPLMPRPIEDVARALRFIKEHAAEILCWGGLCRYGLLCRSAFGCRVGDRQQGVYFLQNGSTKSACTLVPSYRFEWRECSSFTLC